MVKVSICIPAFNNAQAVRRLLESVEKQDFKDYEVIITDDSGGDEIKRLAEAKEYIKYYKNEKPLGAAANWNAAVAKGNGEYVKIMHHDDWFTRKESLREFVDMLDRHPEADLAFSGSRQAEEERSYDRYIASEDAASIQSDYRNLFLGNTIGAPSAVIVRRAALGLDGKKGGAECAIVYDEKLKWLVDMDYYMNLLKRNPRFVFTKEPLVSIGISGAQLTEDCRDDKELNAFEYGYIYEKYRLGTLPECRRKLTHILAEAGKSAKEAAAFGIGGKEYGIELGRKLLSKIQWKLSRRIDEKKILAVLFFLFVLGLLPILALSGINHATGDDLGYGRLTREAWMASHSLWEVLKAAGKTVEIYYYGWQGTWLTIFLFTLQPEVFSAGAYVIVPFLMLAIWLGSTWILLHYLLVKMAGVPKTYFGMIYLLFAMAAIHYAPSTKSAIFWYNGTVHYVIPYAIALMGIYFYLRVMDDGQKFRTGSYIGLTVCMAMLGGVNYQAALLTPMIMVLFACCLWKYKKIRKKAAVCILPLLLELAGLAVSMTAPGNKVRGGEAFGFSIQAVAGTIVSCFARGAVKAWQYVTGHPFLLLIFAAAAYAFWQALKKDGVKKKYPYPAVFVFFSYCVYCAMFAPEIYAGVEVSGGVHNMNFYMFLFMAFSDMIYVEGALAGRRKKEGKRNTFYLPAAVILAAGFLLVFRGDIKRTAAFLCVDYIRSGQAADFKDQMEFQLSVLLDDTVKDVVLPAVNDAQGPLMHMPLTEDPEAWTNSITKMFYGKNSVVAVPREIWNEMQGIK